MGRLRWRRGRLLGWAAALLLLAGGAVPAWAQTEPSVSKHSLGLLYRQARLQLKFEELLGKNGFRMALRPYEDIPSTSDLVRFWLTQTVRGTTDVTAPSSAFSVEKWRLIRKLERIRHSKRFAEANLAYIGNTFFTPLDTTLTRELRARLQAKYGAPTRTLAELDYADGLTKDEYIQFEYWFILNDTIPFVVMDVHGPFDRGLVVATENAYRDKLYDMRQAFLATLPAERERGAYVDYYYNYDRRQWYETGFDGQRFFLDAIGHPNLARGRPSLDTPGR